MHFLCALVTMGQRLDVQIHRKEVSCVSGTRSSKGPSAVDSNAKSPLEEKPVGCDLSLFLPTAQVMARQLFMQLISQVEWLVRGLYCDHPAQRQCSGVIL